MTRLPLRVIPAKAGISVCWSSAYPHEIPAFAGMTIWGNRHG